MLNSSIVSYRINSLVYGMFHGKFTVLRVFCNCVEFVLHNFGRLVYTVD